jgi:6-pyruvoyltetrahydropterin/6-carboxytetrahydropterin synthase
MSASAHSASVTTIEITKDYLHFSAAHFTIFSANHRENLHGHNFFVGCFLDSDVGAEGLCFDYNVVKTKLNALCESLDERTLLPGSSPHLAIEERDDQVIAKFAGERIPFLARDVLVLPIRNVTIEELAGYLSRALLGDPEIAALPIKSLTVRVSSGPGQWAACRWEQS